MVDLRPSGQFRARIRWKGVAYALGTYTEQADAERAVTEERARLEAGTSRLLHVARHTHDGKQFAEVVDAPHGSIKRWLTLDVDALPALRVGNRIRIDPEEGRAWIARRFPDTIAIARASVVYFAQRGRDSAVKIGFTSDVERRMRELRKDTRDVVVLRASFPGDKPDELRLHARFAAHRLDGEWFAPHADLLAFLDSLGRTAA